MEWAGKRIGDSCGSCISTIGRHYGFTITEFAFLIALRQIAATRLWSLLAFSGMRACTCTCTLMAQELMLEDDPGLV